MAKSDTLSTQLHSVVKSKPKSAVQSLITLERSQKLDLLMHLLANLRQSLVVSGPSGIGKTTFLKVLQERSRDDWFYCPIPGAHNLSFENIQEQLKEFIKRELSDKNVSELGTSLLRVEQKNQKLVLIVDNAGQLVPGVIDAINQYASEYSVLRVVFALSQDELYVKNRSDKTIEDCHFIELPPLSEHQCGVFLKYLSTKPGAPVSNNAINENMIASVYKETHGIPGLIKAELPKVPDYQPKTEGTWWSVAFVLAMMVAGFLYVLIDNNPAKQEQLSSVAPIQQDSQYEEIAASVLEEEPIKESPELRESLIVENSQSISDEESTQNLTGKSTGQVTTESGIRQDIAGAEAISKLSNKVERESESVSSFVEPKEQAQPIDASEIQELVGSEIVEGKDKDWLFKQEANNYTLQLVALSQEKSLKTVKGKYSSTQYDFKSAKTKIGNKEKFILLYGSFNSYSTAARAMKTLPKEFRNAWVRQFKVLQNEVKKAQ